MMFKQRLKKSQRQLERDLQGEGQQLGERQVEEQLLDLILTQEHQEEKLIAILLVALILNKNKPL